MAPLLAVGKRALGVEVGGFVTTAIFLVWFGRGWVSGSGQGEAGEEELEADQEAVSVSDELTIVEAKGEFAIYVYQRYGEIGDTYLDSRRLSLAFLPRSLLL
jgi:hypothetical protein